MLNVRQCWGAWVPVGVGAQVAQEAGSRVSPQSLLVNRQAGESEVQDSDPCGLVPRLCFSRSTAQPPRPTQL